MEKRRAFIINTVSVLLVCGIVYLFFRVTGTFRNCTITANSSEKILAQRMKIIAVPGEMENLILLRDKFAEACDEITVELEAEND